jgi:arylsulfatase
METIDDETSAVAIDFIDRQYKVGKPFFCWFNSARMHSGPMSMRSVMASLG